MALSQLEAAIGGNTIADVYNDSNAEPSATANNNSDTKVDANTSTDAKASPEANNYINNKTQE